MATQAVHVPLVPEYYVQRGKIPGTLLITEGTCIAEKAGGLPAVPGVFSDVQIAAWKEVCLTLTLLPSKRNLTDSNRSLPRYTPKAATSSSKSRHSVAKRWPE